MKDLPIEILNAIFLQLSLNQKLECFQVCRKWSQVLRSGCLLDTVDLYGIGEIEAFFEFLNDNPHCEGQVKHAVLVNNYEVSFHVPSLCLSFPKLSTMCLKEVRPYDSYFRIPPNPEERGLKDLRNSITKIIDFGHCDYMGQLLASGVCHRLTSLTLDVHYDISIDEAGHIVSLFRNAPNLLKLSMTVPIFNIPTLDLLHTNLQQLETLVLDCVEFLIDEHGHLPNNIIMASSVNNLSLHVGTLQATEELLLLDYIKRKYNNLHSFGLYDLYSEEWDEQNISRLTTSGYIPFIQHYGQQLKSLHIQSLLSESTMFILMDGFDYKLESLAITDVANTDIFKMIVASNQHKFIKELSLKGIDASDTPFELLDRFTCLCKLELCYITTDDYRPTIDLNALLNSCSNTLASLILGNTIMTCNQTPDQSQKRYNLQKIQLDSDDIPSGFSLFLSRYCHRLTHLTFNGSNPFVMALNIPNIHLSCFKLKSPTSKGYLDISVTTSGDNHRSYGVHYQQHNISFLDELTETFGTSVCTTVPQVPLSTGPTFELTCASVKDIIINNFLAC